MSKSNFPTRIDPINLPRHLRDGLEKAASLLEQKKAVEAKKLLKELEQKYPRQPDVLGLLANSCIDTGDVREYLNAMFELQKLRPNSPDVNLGLAGAYLSTGRMALALRAFERFLDRFPAHPAADDARKTVGMLQEGLKDILGELNMDKEAGLAFARKHEELQVCLDTHQFQRGKSLAKELLATRSNFAPALNNLSQIYWLEGNLTGAIETCQKVLAFEPDNIHALANIIRFLYLAGRKDETPAYVKRLKESKADAADRWKKIAETLSFIGDDQGMLDLHVRVVREKELEGIDEFFYHFLAVSELMLGQESAAKSDWKRALKISPGFTLAQENLDDLKLPKHERNGPWAHPFAQVLSEKTIREMTAVVGRAAKSKDEASFQPTVRSFLDTHPEILQLAALILERGEAGGKELIIIIADISGHPEFLSLLKDFTFGQRGPDALRLKASQVLSKHNAAPTGEVAMWIAGEWKPILLVGFEITPEPMLDENPLNPKALGLMEKAINALREENGVVAEQCLRKALLIHPEHPSLLNNLSLALLMQERKEEAERIIQHVIEDFPDYFFGQMACARKAIQAGDKEKARSILEHWMKTKKKYHVTEFNMLAKTQIDLLIQEKLYEGAFSWLEMWKKTEPDDPDFEDYQERLELLQRLSKLKDRQPGRRKPKKKKRP